MARRFYTCIIVPDTNNQLHKLKVPERTLHAFAVIGVLSFFVAIALGFSYTKMAFMTSDYKKLEAENTDLKIKTTNFQVSTTKLSSKINELKSISMKLTKVIENDPTFSQSRKMNVKPEGESRTDITTSQLEE